jgi:hypothetical protein
VSPSRILRTHVVAPTTQDLDVFVLDAPGHGGAHHQYLITSKGFDFHVPLEIAFQNGPINEVGVNGVTHEALLAVLIDRLRCFQAGPYACRENALALTNIEQGLQWLHARTRERMFRNVEGTHTP